MQGYVKKPSLQNLFSRALVDNVHLKYVLKSVFFLILKAICVDCGAYQQIRKKYKEENTICRNLIARVMLPVSPRS